MSLTNAQYDAISRLYQDKQLRNRKKQEINRATAYKAIPRLSEIDREISSASLRKARFALSGEGQDFDLKALIADLSAERRALLAANGFPEDFLDLSYDCPICRDTGYVNGEKCSCFRREEITLLYDHSNLSDILEVENFDHFSLDYYSDQADPAAGGFSPREMAQIALKQSQEFAANFTHEFQNICYYGDTGVGKTFLSHCLARELIEAGHSVLYLTAFDLFDLLAQHQFHNSEELRNQHQHIFESDLLIIDDLGTELTNTFVSSQLFLCINERILNRKSTVISTNLSLKEFSDVYSERTFSRILSYYKMIRLLGQDIRIQKRLSGRS